MLLPKNPPLPKQSYPQNPCAFHKDKLWITRDMWNKYKPVQMYPHLAVDWENPGFPDKIRVIHSFPTTTTTTKIINIIYKRTFPGKSSSLLLPSCAKFERNKTL
jgi:hypothetical protein